MKTPRTIADMRSISELLTAAERESVAMGQADPGAEHLLLAALTVTDGSARAAFAALGGGYDSLSDAIARNEAQALAAIGVTADPTAPGARAVPRGRGPYRSKGSLQELFQAMKRAANAQHGPLRSAHVLVAAADLTEGTLARALALMKIDRDELRAAALAAISPPG